MSVAIGRGVAVVLGGMLAAGCVLFPPAAPAVAPQPEAQAYVAAPVPVEAVVPVQAEVPVQAPSVEVGELRAVLGETVDSAGVRGVIERLGAPVVRGTAEEPIHAFAEHGVFFKLDGEGRVAEVALFGAGKGRSAFRGTLPAGLRFGMSVYQVGKSVGVDIPTREVGRRDNTRVFRAAVDGGRTFRGHGLRVHFDGGELSFVVLLPDAGAGSVHLDDVIAYPGEEHGVHGMRVYYQVSAAEPACAGVDVELRIVDSAAAAVRARAMGGRSRAAAAAAAFKIVDEGVACRGDDRMLFVPFGDLELAAGRQEGRVQLAARPVKGRGAKEVVARSSALVGFEMPAVVLVRLKVSAGIQRDVFNRRNTAAMLTFGLSALGARPKLHPDPFWVLEAGRHHHRSKTRPNTFTPRWAESTAWFPLAEGDTLTLYFADEDVGDNERLATFRIGVEQLRAAIRDRVVLSADWVESLVLAESELREGGAR